MDGKILISIYAHIIEDSDDYLGAEIESYDPDAGTAALYVEPDEIEARVIKSTSRESYEHGGVPFSEDFHEVEIKSCEWEGHSILNDEDVCWELIDRGITWH